MEKTKILKDVLVLLKAAKSHPEKFADLFKDDMPHPANSPEDKAHDVKEEDESLKQALELLNTPEKRSKMLEHLRSLQDESDLRSPENQEVGQESMEKQSNPLFTSEHEKGVHKDYGQGKSLAGKWFRGAGQAKDAASKIRRKDAREMHQEKLQELKQMPKPNLPKSEEDMKKKGDKDMNKSEKSALELAKELLKAAKEDPTQFEELSKALTPAAAPAPSIGKPPMPKPSMPKPPKMHAPGMMKEEKEESKEDESKEHEEKEGKEHEEKEMEKAAKKMDKCGDMKMSKEEIKADLKKEWKPKFKKEKC